jgi:hypothetical protein
MTVETKYYFYIQELVFVADVIRHLMFPSLHSHKCANQRHGNQRKSVAVDSRHEVATPSILCMDTNPALLSGRVVLREHGGTPLRVTSSTSAQEQLPGTLKNWYMTNQEKRSW